ncbi:MAG: YiaA/YiaB family inner membrane protein [Verrucomicrobiales bacterium]
MPSTPIQPDSGAWVAFIKVSFLVAFGATAAGIYLMPTDLWVKGYLFMGMLFTTGSTFSLAKTMRDQHETRRLINRVEEAKTEKILKEFS